METKNTKIYKITPYFVIFLERRDLILSAFPFLITPFLAARSTAEKALLRDADDNDFLNSSTAVLAFVLVALLNVAFFLSALSFLIADLIIGMSLFYHDLLLLAHLCFLN